MTKKQCKNFIADVKGAIWGNANHPDDAIVEAAFIAERLDISLSKANQFLWACARYGITERQGGGWVV